jgi:hypothetical protein
MVTGGARESGEPLELLPMKSFVDWEVLAGLQMEYQEEHPSRPIPQAALLQALQKINDGSPIENEDEEDSLVGAAAFPPPAVSLENTARAFSSPAVVPCMQAGGTGTRYILRARRERTEQQVLRQGMARSPFGGPVRRTRDSSHPYKRGYTS